MYLPILSTQLLDTAADSHISVLLGKPIRSAVLEINTPLNMSPTSNKDSEPTTTSATRTLSTLETDRDEETALNSQRNQAFSSLIRIGHLNPTLASVLASTYRTLLVGNTYIRQQADHHDIDSAWLYCLYSVLGIVALGLGEMGLSFAAKLMGIGKWLLLIPAAGIPALKVLERRGAGEIVEFLRGERGRRDEKDDEERREES
ncbi:MAG: hypothetical protein L6R35_006488 [Caloplaca aegaea]|nr:MAG: hypothetical protein L6R35_006488 [Caloplaca aegaea]